MTVEELIGELMASANSLDDEVRIGNVPGPITRVSGDGVIWLNDYEESGSDDDQG